jgi:hypothetical protein
MTKLLITQISGFTTPFSGTACDVYGNNCGDLGEATTVPFLFTLPSQFNTAPAVRITLIDSTGCEFTQTIYCTGDVLDSYKQFQNFEYFVFMDSEPYQFEF